MHPIRIYLDQNHFITLAGISVGKVRDPDVWHVHELLIGAVNSSRVLCPLSRVHIIETSRRGDRDSRMGLATLLVALSDGWMLAGRSTRLRAELEVAVGQLFGLDVHLPPEPWPFVRGFFEGFGSIPYIAENTGVSARSMELASASVDPCKQILSFLEFPDEALRLRAIERHRRGAEDLVHRIEDRREKWRSESQEMRWRAYSAIVFLENQNAIARALSRWGRTFDDLRELEDEKVAGLLGSVPILDVERLLAVRLEQQHQRPLQANDANDLDALCGAIPYCDFVVSEGMWASLAKQARLSDSYRGKVLRNLPELGTELERLL